jgi:hypothetical protein
MTISRTKINDVHQRADRLLDRNGIEDGVLELGINSKAWADGNIEAMIKTNIPQYLTTDQAKHLGWALYWLGRHGASLEEAVEHTMTSDDAKEL